MLTEKPRGICDACWDGKRDSWTNDFWFYCAHNRIMARRRSRSEGWTISKRIAPKKASRHLDAVIAHMAKYMADRGLDPKEVDSLLNQYRSHDPDSSAIESTG